MFLWGTDPSRGGAEKKFVGEAFHVVGDVGEGKNWEGGLKNREGTQKIHGGVISWGLLQRGVYTCLTSKTFVKGTCWDIRATGSIIKSDQKDTEASIPY